MKLSILALMFPAFSFAHTNANVDFSCMTEFPSTTYELKTDTSKKDAEVQFTVIHHFGTKNMSIHQGIITPYDFPYLQAKAEVMQKLGDNFTVSFKKDRCEVSGPELVSCGSSTPAMINGIEVRSYGLVTRVVETKVYEYTYKTHQVTFSFVYGGMNYDIPMSYTPQECKFN